MGLSNITAICHKGTTDFYLSRHTCHKMMKPNVYIGVRITCEDLISCDKEISMFSSVIDLSKNIGIHCEIDSIIKCIALMMHD